MLMLWKEHFTTDFSLEFPWTGKNISIKTPCNQMELIDGEAGLDVPAVHLTLPDCSPPWEAIFTVSPGKGFGFTYMGKAKSPLFWIRIEK
ncbi:unnamed protein product [marine sediment metagenome]|uniref:Uncharacterized protein n=1 Tax=marine sediment metagenome TaxID=412755 RepID=X1JW28_9ZZZZ